MQTLKFLKAYVGSTLAVIASVCSWISSKLDSPIDMMVYRVMLGYKSNDFRRPATFVRKRIDTQIDGDYEAIESVEFDMVHKLYYYCAVNPEPGYIYRLRWEK